MKSTICLFFLFAAASFYTHCQELDNKKCSSKTEDILSLALEKAQEGNSETAIALLQEGLGKSLSVSCKGKIYLQLGTIYHNSNQLVQAVKYLDEAAKIFAANGMPNQQILAMNIIGGCYYLLGDYDISAKNTLKAIRIAKENLKFDLLGELYNNLAGSYLELQMNDSALKYAEISIKMSTEEQDRSTLLHALSTKAEIQLKQKNYSEAEREFERVLELGRKEGLLNPYIESNCLYGIASSKFMTQQYVSAREFGRKAFQLAIFDEHLKIAENSAKLLYELWKRSDQKDSAYHYLEQLVLLQKRIQPSENLSQLNRFRMRQAEIQITEKEKEAEKQKYYTTLGIITAVLLFLLFISIFLFYRNTKRLNRRLQESNQTINTANSQLAIQRDELNNLNKIKDKIFSAVIHDFKTPMNTLESMLNMLIKKYLTPEEASEHSKTLLEKLKKSKLAINNTIAWIKTQLEGYEVQRQVIQLGEFVNEIKSYHSSELQKKQIKIKTNINEELMFYSDKELLFIILNNLVSNAIKFSDKNTEIKIISEESSDRLNITVKDEGIGMKKSDLEKILSLKSLSQESGTEHSGSGLGLRISNELLTNIGGKMSVESTKGKGTLFSVRIPLHKTS
ncbi:ATP-binding protein [Marivirga harenae]|uniref:tetratricopeptide repeat-containing sensor histidine kinase n=2 Tax=Marivirga TaxID=869806 RepID=UPI0026E09F2B|nr:ATP-binding protein [Marivirga harenae]WKV12453.1 ATP-binding protein [Marivirga harenae]|tara:strand:- start:79949 stop:81814 length:1866 start_codon:yes stop_codon:yes gene_type:complete